MVLKPPTCKRLTKVQWTTLEKFAVATAETRYPTPQSIHTLI